MNKLIWILMLLLTAYSCSPTVDKNESSGAPSDEHSANHHMHKTSFDELVERFEDSSRADWQKPDVVLAKLGNLEGKTIADIGAGSGYFTFRLAEKGAKVLALDVDQRFLDYIEAKKDSLNSKLIISRKIPFDNPRIDSNTVDGVIIVDTYHHIEDRVNYFRKVKDGLIAGGSLIVVDFKKEETPHGPPVKMRLAGFDVLKELQKAGFSKVIIDVNSLPEQYIITAKKADEEPEEHPLLREVRKK